MNTNWIRRAEARHEGERDGLPLWDVRDVREGRARIESARVVRGADTGRSARDESSSNSDSGRRAAENP